ncbi:MAG: rRNA maturation RNase YbeY [SAR324 cluster bacterium]|jgi:rRNA maturation RNase YbeY|nr:rRNA maturation RNase YbeY [SAR324 cluster bacterium]
MIEIRCDADWQGLINQKQLAEILKVFLWHLFESERGISLYLTDDTEIQKLNQQFRGKNSPTDILSWPYTEDDVELSLPKIDESEDVELAGDLVVSVERVRKQATENGWDFETELIRLLAHGCAHLAGWDHERSANEANEMLELEIALLKEVGYENIY